MHSSKHWKLYSHHPNCRRHLHPNWRAAPVTVDFCFVLGAERSSRFGGGKKANVTVGLLKTIETFSIRGTVFHHYPGFKTQRVRLKHLQFNFTVHWCCYGKFKCNWPFKCLNVKSCIRTLLCSISGTEHLKELKMVYERTEFET